MTGEKNRFKTTEKLWNLDDKQLSSPVHDALVLWLMEEQNAKKMLEPLTFYCNEKDFINPNRLDVCSFAIRSEIPFQSPNGFINAYGDLEISRHETIKKKYYECKVSEKVFNQIKEAKTVGDLMSILEKNYLFTDFKPSLNDGYYKKREFSYSEEEWDMENWVYSQKSYYGDYNLLDIKLADFFRNFTGIPKDMNITELQSWIMGNDYYSWTTNHIKCLIEVKPYIDSFGAVLRQINSYKSFWHPRGYSNEGRFVCLFTLDDRFDSQFESQGIKVLHPPADFNIDETMKHYGLED